MIQLEIPETSKKPASRSPRAGVSAARAQAKSRSLASTARGISPIADDAHLKSAEIIPTRPAASANGARAAKSEPVRAKVDFAASLVRPGEILFRSHYYFSRSSGDRASKLAALILGVPGVQAVRVDWDHYEATISYDKSQGKAAQFMRLIAGRFREGAADESLSSNPDVRLISADYHLAEWRMDQSPAAKWSIVHSLPNRLRMRSAGLRNNRRLQQNIEKELLTVFGVDSYKVSTLTGSVVIDFDPRHISGPVLYKIIKDVTANTGHSFEPDKVDHDFTINCATIPLAIGAELLLGPFGAIAAGAILAGNIPTFKSAWQVTLKERRLGVDLLDAIVVAGCLATGHLIAASVIGWCLSFGRVLLRKTREDSQKLIQGAFCKQSRTAWLLKDGQEIEVSLDKVHPGDIVVVHAGEAIPADGKVAHGLGLVDQHTLTGESAPAEKGPGEEVFATTVLMSGSIHVCVERSGSATTSAKIGEILRNTAAFKLQSQTKGERFADRAVPPTLAVGGVGLASLGLDGAVALLNSECGTAIRMAAPLGMLSSLTLCANNGILVKDGRALENMTKVDTVLFDKTGTLTKEQPEVRDIHTFGSTSPDEILRLAAIAEQRFTHPIACAILAAAKQRGLKMEQPDSSDYQLGMGIEVVLKGRKLRVGSPRFLEAEGLKITPGLKEIISKAGNAGKSIVLVGIDQVVAGGIELEAAHRPEAKDVIIKLREMGVKHMAVISGDREEPTRRLAESLGLDRYFAQVLPQDKALAVEQLQNEGARVCFVGDGVNDAIALRKADVSISLRGASAIATDTAQVVLLEDNLMKICDLLTSARDLEHNTQRSWQMIVAPNLLCVVGVFTMGFGVFHSVLTNNVAALGAIANGMLPLRKAARIRASKDLAAEELLLHAEAHRLTIERGIRVRNPLIVSAT